MIQKGIRFLLALTLILTGMRQVFAQNLVFETISTPAGFDSHEIADIRQDPQGYLWLATGSGLMRFDGYTWTVWQHDPKNANSLAGDNIRVVCPTRNGLVWVGGWAAGLDCLDPETGKITHHQVVKRKEYKYEENAITALQEDHLGNLWVGTASGLYQRKRGTDTFIPYLSVPKNPRTLSHPHVSSIYEDKQGTLWVGTGDQGSTRVMDGGLNRFERETGNFTRYLHNQTDTTSLVENRVMALFEDSHGTFWVGTGGDGLHTLDRKTGRFTRYPYQEAHTERLSRPFSKEKNLRKFLTNGIQFFREDPAGAIWIGTLDAGTNRYDPATGLVTHYESPADGLPDYNLLSSCRARDGTLWMGTIPGHLIKVTTLNNLIRKVKMRSGVHYFEEDSTGNLWLGTVTGLVLNDPSTTEAKKWLNQASRQTKLVTDHVTRINTDREGDRWISTWNDGLYRYQKSTRQFTHYQHDSADITSLSPGETAGFYHDRDGARWVLTAGGLDRIDPVSNKFTHFRHKETDTTSVSNNYMLVVMEDHTGKFWVGTNGGGINLMDRKTGKFRHFLSWHVVTQLVEDASGTLWVVSSAGLHYYDRKKGEFASFNDPVSGKILPFVKAMTEDDRGNLWAAISSGIVAISRDRKTLRWFGANYGIHAGEDFFFGSGYKRRDGSIYFGSMERYFHFKPDVLLKTTSIPPMLNFAAFRVHNQVLMAKARSIELAHNQNVFSIDFAAIDFRHPELHLYTYKLENYDREWHPISADRTANYFGVPPGQYIFRVKVSNSDGIWVEKSMTIVIAPPWWQTGWAYLCYAISLAAFFFAGWQMLLGRERANNALKIKELRSQQLLEMDRIKSDFFANVSHEFRTPLTLILSPLEHWLTRLPADSEYAVEFASMHRNARRLLHLVNQMLDLSKLEAGKMQIEMRPGDLIHFVKRIADSFISLAERQDVTFHTTMPEGNLWLNFDADKLEKILNNLLSNAFKFTPANGHIALAVQLSPDPKIREKPSIWVEFKVTDSGSGIPAEHLDRIFDRFHQVDNSLAREHEGTGIGLALTRELVELQDGTISVSSSPGQGSLFTVSLPIEMLHVSQSGQNLTMHNAILNETPDAADKLNIENISSRLTENMNWNDNPDAPVVLIVEDNADLRRFISQSLTEHSVYRVMEAMDGKEGYLLAQEHIPDLVISDIMMPKMDGIEFCRRLKTDEKTSHIPIILLTAKASSESKMQGLGTRADDYLTKPFVVRELLARIDNLIEVRRELRERYTRHVLLQPENIAVSSIDEHFLSRAMAIIQQYMADTNFGVELFGREIGMSRMQLYRKLHALTGKSPSDFIRFIRLQRAAQLLSANSGTVSQIADQVGFGSHSYFSKCFQEQFGKTPSAFVAELDRTH